MKNKTSITALLGLRQQDVAMLLQVHPTQWSMYESGKRDLPLHAKQLLAEILTHINTSTSTSKIQPETVKRQVTPQLLERLLRENEYQQLLFTRKIAVTKKKFDAQFKVMKVVAFLNGHPSQKGMNHKNMLESMAKKASNGLETKAVTALLAQELKLELLVLERKLLEKKLRGSA